MLRQKQKNSVCFLEYFSSLHFIFISFFSSVEAPNVSRQVNIAFVLRCLF